MAKRWLRSRVDEYFISRPSGAGVMSVDPLYLKLLERAYKIVAPRVERRGEIPKLNVEVEPRRTIIRNFKEIADRLNRDVTHMARFFIKELAVPGNVDPNGSLVIYAERTPRTLEAVYERYIRLYVTCPVCGSIDTYLVKEDRIYVLVCTACGARTPRRA